MGNKNCYLLSPVVPHFIGALGTSDTFACKHRTNASGIFTENHIFWYRFLVHVNSSPVFLMVEYSKIKTRNFKEFKVLYLVKSRVSFFVF